MPADCRLKSDEFHIAKRKWTLHRQQISTSREYAAASRNVSPAIIKINTISLRRVFYLLVGVAAPGASRHKIYWINTISVLYFQPPPLPILPDYSTRRIFTHRQMVYERVACSLRYQLYVTHGLSLASRQNLRFCLIISDKLKTQRH